MDNMRTIKRDISSDYFAKIFNRLSDGHEYLDETYKNRNYEVKVVCEPNTFYNTEVGKCYSIKLLDLRINNEYYFSREVVDRSICDYMGNTISAEKDHSEFFYMTNDNDLLETFRNLDNDEFIVFVEKVVSRCEEVIKESPAYWESKKKNLMESI